MANFKDLIVWQKSISVAERVYKMTSLFPPHQKYSLVDQMQRAAVSIMSNIAEGSKRSKKECEHFLRFSHGSAAELESQILLAVRLEYMTSDQADLIMDDLNQITRMLYTMISSYRM
ncbi:MAG: four helix bundle protein [Patescibacteria group bacterium]